MEPPVVLGMTVHVDSSNVCELCGTWFAYNNNQDNQFSSEASDHL